MSKAVTEESAKTLAAIDLGSNSFHMIVAQIENDQIKVIDRLKESVRLGEGLTEEKTLLPHVEERALKCLARFGQRVANLKKKNVRVVGTNTLRRINDGGQFLAKAKEVLGRNIEIIAGREEARLIYIGVSHDLEETNQQRLVVDIGGGSTELILGKQMESSERESLFMGCVSMSRRFFPDGAISREAMDSAVLAAQLELHPVRLTYHASLWQHAVGSSGTIRAIRDVLHANLWCHEGISRKGLKKLKKKLIENGHIDQFSGSGLSDDRRPVFTGGVAILFALFKSLEIRHMRVSGMALREGLLFEMLGNIQHHDVRNRTVETLIQRFSLDPAQGLRIAQTADSLYRQAATDWHFQESGLGLLLGWAARLHELGLAISHSAYHKHGAYILERADLPGFSQYQQSILAALVASHRRKFLDSAFSELGKELREPVKRLSILLRLSVLLHRGHAHRKKPKLHIAVSEKNIVLKFPGNWLKSHPLTVAELDAEVKYLKTAGYTLKYR
jgi:exopolyphosphatase/guanosine-5'-triphosphate,3'-diphosphate pyrophosphatase